MYAAVLRIAAAACLLLSACSHRSTGSGPVVPDTGAAVDLAGAPPDAPADAMPLDTRPRPCTPGSGTLDPSFGTNGVAAIGVGEPTDTVVQPDGKLVVAGPYLARYTPTGSPDTSFGGGAGYVVTGMIGAGALALLADGKILVAGYVKGTAFAVERYSQDGVIDPAFGTSGQAVIALQKPPAGVSRLAVRPGGQIVLYGTVGDGSFDGYRAVVGQLHADGSVDNAFGAGGVVELALGEKSWHAAGGALDSQGRFVCSALNIGSYVLARVDTTGKQDMGLGAPMGHLVLAGGLGRQLVLAKDDRIYLAGAFDDRLAVTRLNKDGSVDSSFGTGGTTAGQVYPAGSKANAIVLLADGGMLVGAYDTGGILLARVLSDGSPDPCFGAGGLASLNIAAGLQVSRAVVIHPGAQDGAVIAGMSDQFFLARFLL
jgi:uncharacterized delta-60 repeat protein